MKIVKFRDWELLVDREATQQVYDKIDGGIADGCECNACKNYINDRENILPEEIKFLFKELGIDPSKECENCHSAVRKNGLHHYYSTWYHFKGQFKNINSSELDSTKINDNFFIGFKYDATLTFFEDIGNLVQVEINIEIPWTIEKELENLYE